MSKKFFTEKRKKILIANTIKLVIGILLLGASASYLRDHPAEKASITSGFTVISQKIEVIWYRITGKEADTLQKHHSLQKSLKELVKTIEDANCEDLTLLQEATEKYNELKALSFEEFSDKNKEYIDFFYNHHQKFQQSCE